MARVHYELQSPAHPYCGACLERWPCKTVDLETRLTAAEDGWQRTTAALVREKERRLEADAAGRELARDLLDYWGGHHLLHCGLGCSGEALSCRAPKPAALANPVVVAWLKEGA